MDFYNISNRINPATFFILPMLGEKHPDEYPLFCDCSIEDNLICIYLRVGGDNRNGGFGDEELYEHPNFVKVEDDETDNTYASYYFTVPEEWMSDYKEVIKGNIGKTSSKYRERILKVFPDFEKQINCLFAIADLSEIERRIKESGIE